jgi:hypothetical protein
VKHRAVQVVDPGLQRGSVAIVPQPTARKTSKERSADVPSMLLQGAAPRRADANLDTACVLASAWSP